MYEIWLEQQNVKVSYKHEGTKILTDNTECVITTQILTPRQLPT